MNTLTSSPRFFRRRSAAMAAATLAVFGLFCWEAALASADATASAPLANLGFQGAGQSELVVTLKTRSCALRKPENSNYFELLVPAGSLDCDASDFSFSVRGGGEAVEVVRGSVSVATKLDSTGHLERFVASGRLKLRGGTQPFQIIVMAKIIERSIEHQPVRAYVQPGSMSVSGFADLSEYSFKVVYEVTSESSGDASFLLNKTVIQSDAEEKRGGEGFEPFADTLLAGTAKTYPVTAPLRGPTAAHRRGVYRSVSIGEDGEGRPFVVAYEVELSAEAVLNQEQAR